MVVELATLAEVGAWAASMARSASLVLVLPTEPVTLASGLARHTGATRSPALHGVGHADQRAARGLDIARDHRGRGSALHRPRRRNLTICGLAAQGKEQVILDDGRLSKVTPFASNDAAIVAGAKRAPPRAEVQSALTSRPPRTRARLRVVEMMRHAFDRLPVSWPCRISSRSSLPRSASCPARWRHAGRPALRPSSFGRPECRARSRRVIAAGSSLRGLSSVTSVRSARRVAISPITAVGAIAIATAAKHHDQLAAGEGQGRKHGLERLGLVSVSRHRPARPSGTGDELQSAGRAAHARQGLGGARRIAAVGRQGRRGARAFEA